MPLDSIRQQKTRKALCYAGFLDFVGHHWTGIWWSWGKLSGHQAVDTEHAEAKQIT